MGCSTPGILFVNGGEQSCYFKLRIPTGWVVYFNPINIGVCAAMRWLFEKYPDEPWYGLICDDEFVKSESWDVKLIEAAGRWNVSYAGGKKGNLPHCFMTVGGDLVRAVGWFAPPTWHCFMDAAWDVLSRRCEVNKKAEGVVVDERHPDTHPDVKPDATNALSGIYWEEDSAWFQNWLRDKSEKGMLATHARIMKAMEKDVQR